MLLKLSVKSAGSSKIQIVGAAWQNARLPKSHETDNGRRSGDDVMTFGIEIGRIGRR